MTTPPASRPPGWYADGGTPYRWRDGHTSTGPASPRGRALGGAARRRRGWLAGAGVAAVLFAGGVLAGTTLGFGDGEGSGRPGAGAPGVEPAKVALASEGAATVVPADLDVRVTYCSPGTVSGWAQGFAVNNRPVPVSLRITVTFGRSGGTPLGQAPAVVNALAPGDAVNWRTGKGPAGDFDTCDVSAVDVA